MTNLISRIADACQEDITTEILAYLLREFVPCRSAFLSLIDPSVNASNYEVDTQLVISGGRPDLVLRDNKGQGIILIENKPWDSSSFTGGDQMERYAKYLQTCKFQKKTLCLLATDRNKSRLSESAKNVSGIKFVVITWEDVFRTLDSACAGTEHMVARFLLNDLQAWMFPPVVVIPPEVLQKEEQIWEQWSEIKTIVRQARNIAAGDSSLSGYQFMSSPGQTPKPDEKSMNYFGYYIYDKKSGLCLFFGALMNARRFLKDKSLFVLQVRKGWDNASGGKSDIDFDALQRCGFAYDAPSPPSRSWWEAVEYVYPLTDSTGGSVASPEKLAETLAGILIKTSGEINKG